MEAAAGLVVELRAFVWAGRFRQAGRGQRSARVEGGRSSRSKTETKNRQTADIRRGTAMLTRGFRDMLFKLLVLQRSLRHDYK